MARDSPILFWFRQDLRLEDNPALLAACEMVAPIIFLYILDDETPGRWKMGGASRWWLHHSLKALQKELNGYGATLILRKGKASEILPQIVKKYSISAVFCNRCYEPFMVALDEKLQKILPNFETYKAALLFEPWETCGKQQQMYKVYTPFWKACLRSADVPLPKPKPKAIESICIPSDQIEEWQLLPTHPDWAVGLRSAWNPGEKQAHKSLQAFISTKCGDYEEKRDIPSLDGTSRLSGHLHFGEISPSQIYHAIEEHPCKEKFLSEIGWREFAHYQLYHFSDLPETPWRQEFEKFPWESSFELLKKWQQGQTGYPIVDAGMRQLWQTGWMHNRVRMIVASFLVKDLFIPWQEGEKWFWDTLVDADLANNAANWQWVAGCGFDAAPFFRIFNPTLQGQKFDPDGIYIKRWVPELTSFSGKEIHQLDSSLRKKVGYPEPVIDHAFARKRALEAFHSLIH